MKKLISFSLCLLSFGLFAEPSPETLVVSFDAVVIPQEEIAFGRDRNDLRPSLSEFQIEYRRFLSNELGERFALVTFSKEKAILRKVSERDIVGVLANGERLYPVRLEGETLIGSRGSIFVYFGKQPFPLVDLETRIE